LELKIQLEGYCDMTPALLQMAQLSYNPPLQSHGDLERYAQEVSTQQLAQMYQQQSPMQRYEGVGQPNESLSGGLGLSTDYDDDLKEFFRVFGS